MWRSISFTSVVVAALVAGGCGSSGAVDKGGFTNKNRTNAQAALRAFRGTAIPTTIVQLTATIGLPAVCRVHLDAQDSKTFSLIMAWKPLPGTTQAAFTWFKASIGPDGVDEKSLHLGVEPSFQALKAHYGIAFTRPFDPCQIDAFGNLSVVPWTDAYPPSGHARKIPSG